MKVITSHEMKRLDTVSQVAPEILMERAGAGMANFIVDFMPEYPVCFVCGGGNNGGDGFVAARYLSGWGREVEVYIVGSKNKLTGLPKLQAEKLNIKILGISDNNLKYALDRKKIVVDCILGTGFSPPVRDDLKGILEIINKKSKITISCDIPTGVNGDTGEADENSVYADVCVTFEYPKVGHINSPGSEFSGSIEVVKIGTLLSPKEYLEDVSLTVRSDCRRYFEKRSKGTHKKNYGHVLVIGGSPGMEGAVSMAAQGALRSGAGLVTCAVGRSIGSAVAVHGMSAMQLLLEESADGCLSDRNVEGVLEFIEKRKIDCALIGPGMRTADEVSSLTRQLVEKIKSPVVLDADGINNLCGADDIIKNRTAPLVLTPHIGEMARITGKSSKVILKDKKKAVIELSNKLKCTVVLKGYRTMITDGCGIYINSSGNPGMAAGGSGDVLSGICASLIGQGYGALEASRTSVWVHGMAGDIAAWKYGQKYILAEDVLRELSSL